MTVFLVMNVQGGKMNASEYKNEKKTGDFLLLSLDRMLSDFPSRLEASSVVGSCHRSNGTGETARPS